MILVTGSTGKIGQHLIDALLTKGVAFKALAHSEASAAALAVKKIEVVRGDLTDPASFKAALAGVDTLFLLSSSADPFVQEAPALALAVAAGVKKVVKLSAIGASADATNPFLRGHGRSEREIEASGLAWTFLRPSFFMQNWVTYNAAGIAAGQPVYANAGSSGLGWIDTRDIAAVAAEALTHASHEGRIYDLTGPESLSYAQVTGRLSTLLGREVPYVSVPDQAAFQAIQGMGMPADYAWALVTLNQAVRRGLADLTTQTVELVTGHPARTFDAFLSEQLSAFRG